jgi:diphthine-ammonia ligase
MIACNMDARLVKVCSMGLKPQHLGKSIAVLEPYFLKLRDQFQFNVCGEGGEYESAVFDCPLFANNKLDVQESEVVHHVDNMIAPVAYLKLTKVALVPKS